ncbi:YqaJ viral recombinase [Faustovirus]|nr:YqaJ viral recombinase [Faustovirus]
MFNNDKTVSFIKLSPVDMVIRKNLYINTYDNPCNKCSKERLYSYIQSYYDLYGTLPSKIISSTYCSITIQKVPIENAYCGIPWIVSTTSHATYHNERGYLAIVPNPLVPIGVGSENYNIALEYLKNGVISCNNTLWIYSDTLIEQNIDWKSVSCVCVPREYITDQKINEY